MNLHPDVKVDVKYKMTLSEDEAGALDALAGYGADPFLKVFYEKMGRAYMEPYEKGLRSLFKSIQEQLGGPRAAVNRARMDLREAERKRRADR